MSSDPTALYREKSQLTIILYAVKTNDNSIHLKDLGLSSKMINENQKLPVVKLQTLEKITPAGRDRAADVSF